MITRRNLLHGSLAAASTTALSAAAAEPPSNMALSSSNGMACCRRAVERLQAGEDTLDAAVAGVNVVENDPQDASVGYGGLPNEEGVVELDACVMHGPTARAGSVAALRGVKTPSKVAQLVLERSDHVMMVAEGALRFAQAHGFSEEDLLTERSRLAWLTWKESQAGAWGPGQDAPESDGGQALLLRFPGAGADDLAWAREAAAHPPTGTITCLTLNRRGEMSGVTTTSGLAWKMPGRVGDSPIVGAGLYVDRQAGAAGSTGRGEENIRICGAHAVVENMRRGLSPEQACLDALRRVSRNYGDRQDKLRFGLKFYALRKDGEFGAASLWSRDRGSAGRAGPRASFVVADHAGSRLVEAAYLYPSG